MSGRHPAVAGMFYPAAPAKLRDAVASAIPDAPDAPPALALVVPHAGFVYSGRVAGETYASAAIPRRVCLLATNHTGAGPAFSVWPEGAWETPVGPVPVDADLTRSLLAQCPGAEADVTSQRGEHSAEVQLPFLRHRNPDVRIAVVTVACFRLGERERVGRLQEFGRAIGRAVRAAGDPVLCVASSDMSHVGAAFSQPPPDGWTADAFARDQDRAALEPYLALDAARFPRVIRERGVTMCGWAPALVALCAALEQGATKARLVRYATSAEVSGDVHHVVGYAGIVID